jgi:hypothetical protein
LRGGGVFDIMHKFTLMTRAKCITHFLVKN